MDLDDYIESKPERLDPKEGVVREYLHNGLFLAVREELLDDPDVDYVEYDHPGFWSIDYKGVLVAATPFWDSNDSVSVQVRDADGDIAASYEMEDYYLTGNVEDDRDRYINGLKEIIDRHLGEDNI